MGSRKSVMRGVSPVDDLQQPNGSSSRPVTQCMGSDNNDEFIGHTVRKALQEGIARGFIKVRNGKYKLCKKEQYTPSVTEIPWRRSEGRRGTPPRRRARRRKRRSRSREAEYYDTSDADDSCGGVNYTRRRCRLKSRSPRRTRRGGRHRGKNSKQDSTIAEETPNSTYEYLNYFS